MPQYVNLETLEPGESVSVLVSTMGKAWERKPLEFSRLSDANGAPVFRVTSPGGTLDSGHLPGEALEPVAHRTFQTWVKETAGAWAWRTETRADVIRREYVGHRRALARSGRGYPAREALFAARRTLETGKKSANPYGSGSAIWSGCGGSDGAPFAAHGESACRWFENPESKGLRLVGLAHDVGRAGYSYSRDAVEHKGWYLGSDGFGETVAGVVYQLPGRNGRARYLAGYADPHNADSDGRGPALLSLEIIEGEPVDSSWDADPTRREAAMTADGIAERMAEAERDYQDGNADGRKARGMADAARGTGKAWVAACRDARAMWKARHGFPALPGPMARELTRVAIGTARNLRAEYLEERETARDWRADAEPGAYDPARLAGFRDGYAEGESC